MDRRKKPLDVAASSVSERVSLAAAGKKQKNPTTLRLYGRACRSAYKGARASRRALLPAGRAG